MTRVGSQRHRKKKGNRTGSCQRDWKIDVNLYLQRSGSKCQPVGSITLPDTYQTSFLSKNCQLGAASCQQEKFSETASDKTTTPVSVCSVAIDLVTTLHVHTPATCEFRKKGRFNPAKGVTRELPVSWLAVGWRYALLPLVMRGCGMPMVSTAIFPNSSTCETVASQKGKYLIHTVQEP